MISDRNLRKISDSNWTISTNKQRTDSRIIFFQIFSFFPISNLHFWFSVSAFVPVSDCVCVREYSLFVSFSVFFLSFFLLTKWSDFLKLSEKLYLKTLCLKTDFSLSKFPLQNLNSLKFPLKISSLFKFPVPVLIQVCPISFLVLLGPLSSFKIRKFH